MFENENNIEINVDENEPFSKKHLTDFENKIFICADKTIEHYQKVVRLQVISGIDFDADKT